MEASIVDLRYKMKDVLQALERNEEVTVLHRGQVKGTIVPKNPDKPRSAAKHPFFGSVSDEQMTVDEVMEDLRGGRNRAL
ncbi:MAG: type II toxin-antitoxin system Phd/YefM family antitoxin [Verrucomicrobiota bacterium]